MDAPGRCGGTPHLCGSEPAPFNVLPDKSGVPAETMRLDFLRHQGALDLMTQLNKKSRLPQHLLPRIVCALLQLIN